MIKAVMNYELSDTRALALRSIKAPKLYALAAFEILVVIYVLPTTVLYLKNGLNFPAILMLAAIALIIYSIVHRVVISPKKNLENIKNSYGDKPCVYTFGEQSFNASAENGENSENTTISYDALYAAKETGNYFFLYSTENQAYVIKKSAFTEGTPDELSALLLDRLGKKFKGKHN